MGRLKTRKLNIALGSRYFLNKSRNLTKEKKNKKCKSATGTHKKEREKVIAIMSTTQYNNN
jgi:hypothetical protein